MVTPADLAAKYMDEGPIIERQKREHPVKPVGVQFDATDMTSDEIIQRMKGGVDKWTEAYCLSVLHKRFITCPEFYHVADTVTEGQGRISGLH